MDYKELREKYTDWDFSKYIHRVNIYKNSTGDEIRVDELQNGNSSIGYVKFVNHSMGLSVFGDFGNWIFCRPFLPSKEGYVSPMYWNEKLKLNSSQDHSRYDSEKTKKELLRLINIDLEVDFGYRGDDLTKAQEWLSELLACVEDELEYKYQAFRGENPTNIDYEDIPFCKEGSSQLLAVFDAFNEICNKIENS